MTENKERELFHGLFYRSVKLVAKERIGSKTIKCQNSPKTPYRRIMDSPHIQESVKLFLSTLHTNLRISTLFLAFIVPL